MLREGLIRVSGMVEGARKVDSIAPNTMTWLVSAVAGLSLVPIWLNYDIISTDGAFQYIPTALLFLQGWFLEGFARPQPFFPLLIAGVSWVTGFEPELSGRLISAFAFILAVLGIFKLSELIFHDRWVALLAVVFLAANRELAENSVDCLKESLLVCCVIWGNYFILKGLEDSGHSRMLFFAGALTFFFGMFIRSTVFFFIGAWLVVWAFHKQGRMLVRTALLVTPAAAFVVLWHINPDWPFFQKSYDLGLIFHQEHTATGILLAAWKAVVEFFATGNPLVILMGCLGLRLWKKDIYQAHLCLVMGFFLLVLTAWGFTSGRYLLVLMAWIYPLAAYAVVRMLRSGSRPCMALGLIVVLSAGTFWIDKALEAPNANKLARRHAGLYILERFGPDREIVTNRDRLVFYAKGKHIPLEKASGVKHPGRIVAVDVEMDGGPGIRQAMEAGGKEPVRVFGTILVYLPGP